MPSEPQQPLLSQFDKNVGLGGDVTVTVGARRSGIAICAGFDGNWIGSRYIRGAPLRSGADAAEEDADRQALRRRAPALWRKTRHRKGKTTRRQSKSEWPALPCRTTPSLRHAFGQQPERANDRPGKALAFHFTSTMVLPIGAIAIPASFRCCSPNGIPMIVMKQANADNR